MDMLFFLVKSNPDFYFYSRPSGGNMKCSLCPLPDFLVERASGLQSQKWSIKNGMTQKNTKNEIKKTNLSNDKSIEAMDGYSQQCTEVLTGMSNPGELSDEGSSSSSSSTIRMLQDRTRRTVSKKMMDMLADTLKCRKRWFYSLKQVSLTFLEKQKF